MNSKTLNHPVVIHDILLILIVGFGVLFYSLYVIFPHFDIVNVGVKAALVSLLFFAFAFAFVSYLFIEYRYNHLTFKNIFFYLAGGIAIINLIAVACLPSKVNLPNDALLEIFSIDRIYYLLSGIVLAALVVSFFYLIPRRINNRHYVNVILIGLVLITSICIIASFIMEFQTYIDIFSDFTKRDGLESFLGAKNNFARVLLTGIVAVTFLHFRTKNWKWLLVLIPFCLILFLSKGNMAILLAAIYLLIYLIIHLVLLAKKSKDNLVIVSLISGFVVLIGIYFITMVSISTDGILFSIKGMFIEAFEHTKTTFESRQVIWTCSLGLLLPYQFVFGFGASAFPVALHLTYTPIAPEFDKNIYVAHNAGIELIGRGGVLLLLIYLFLYVYLFYICIKIYKKKPLYASLMMIMLVGQIIHSIVESYFVCNGNDITSTPLLTIPIICEYYICYNKENKEKIAIIESAKKINHDKSKSKLFNLNKKCLLIEAKHINNDLNN